MNNDQDFAIIYQENYERVFSYFYRKRLSTQTCLELTQETFLRVLSHIDTFRSECPIHYWIFSIAHNIYCSLVREEKMKRAVVTNLANELSNTPETQSHEAEYSIEKKKRLEAVRQAIDELPAMMRKCIIFHAYHELSYKQIARCLDISVNTVKTHLKEGYKKVRSYKKIENLKLQESTWYETQH
jgi:RNA polymerase sigma-70 factor, ECF subfamily